jgi:hypothetical protein
MRISALSFYVCLFFLALAPSVLFSRWLSAQKWERKDKIAAWDPFVKVMAIAGAVILGLASFERFLDQHRQETVKEMLDQSEKRNSGFDQAIKASSAIATAANLSGPDVTNAVTAFWQLYWGELARFEGPQVEKAMVAFGQALRDWQGSGQKPPYMEQLSLQVAHACRAEIEANQKRIDSLRNEYVLFPSGS